MDAADLIRVGEVSAVYPDRGTVRVRFADRDNQVSGELEVIRHLGVPAVGEQVVCLFLGTGMEAGFCLGATFRQGAGPLGIVGWQFADRARVVYDQVADRLTIETTGEVVITAAGGVTITGEVTITGDLHVTGDVDATGTVTDTSGNTNHHVH